MTTPLSWQPEFELSEPRMDDTHREFIALLAAIETAAPGAQAPPGMASGSKRAGR